MNIKKMRDCWVVENAVHEARYATIHTHGGWGTYLRYLDGALNWWATTGSKVHQEKLYELAAESTM